MSIERLTRVRYSLSKIRILLSHSSPTKLLLFCITLLLIWLLPRRLAFSKCCYERWWTRRCISMDFSGTMMEFEGSKCCSRRGGDGLWALPFKFCSSLLLQWWRTDLWVRCRCGQWSRKWWWFALLLQQVKVDASWCSLIEDGGVVADDWRRVWRS